MCVEETVMTKTLRAAIISAALVIPATMTAPVFAQECTTDAGYEPPSEWVVSTPTGFFREPSLLSKLAISTDTGLRSEPRDGFYVETGNMISGEGWISAGPGYRRTLLDGRARLDMSAAVSWNYYTMGQAAFELPHLAHDRLSLAVQARYQDSLAIDYFGLGNQSQKSDQTAYRFKNFDVLASGRVQANRWLAFEGRVGWIPRPDLSAAAGRVTVPNTIDRFSEATAPGITDQPALVHGDVSIVADSRDHAGHPTDGGLYRATVAEYSDREGGAFSFRRYEVEATQFVPLGTRKWILGLHAWGVFSNTSDGATVPFYLMPTIGGKNTLRGFYSYRFHDNDMAVGNVESRWALLTHMDLAVFSDMGTVAHVVSDLNFHDVRRSYGGGIRFHNATSTLLRIDAGHSTEGWRLYFVMSDPFKRATPASGRASVVPFVP
jgi:outer membrane protein assembly factor BamA